MNLCCLLELERRRWWGCLIYRCELEEFARQKRGWLNAIMVAVAKERRMVEWRRLVERGRLLEAMCADQARVRVRERAQSIRYSNCSATMR